MTCNEVAEFVSALCDGETIPRTAAEHAGACEACQRRLKEYLEIGAELRRVASLEFPIDARPQDWEKRSELGIWWQRGWQTMRIPRFAFAVLLAMIAVLGSSLAVVGVHARSQGAVVLLRIAPVPGQFDVCPLSTEDKKWQVCASLRPENSNAGLLRYEVKYLSRDGARVELGVRTKYSAFGSGFHMEDAEDLPQQRYWFEPGKTLQLDVAGLGTIVVTGEWMDHMPSVIAENHDLDPGPQELRLIAPLLLRGKEVVGEFDGGNITVDKVGKGIVIFLPGQGRFELSLSPLPGALRAQVKLNRISFEIDGEPYAFITGAPITRSEQVWVLHDSQFKPSGELRGVHGPYIGTVDLNQLPYDESPKN